MMPSGAILPTDRTAALSSAFVGHKREFPDDDCGGGREMDGGTGAGELPYARPMAPVF